MTVKHSQLDFGWQILNLLALLVQKYKYCEQGMGAMVRCRRHRHDDAFCNVVKESSGLEP